MSPTATDRAYAAIDLGSNSFHMVIAEAEGNSIRLIDSLRMPVRLGAGLDKHKNITPATETVAMEAFAQFAERLRGVPRKQIRAVGTNTLRRAKNARPFMKQAAAILDKHIEVISGREEARLIYTAIAHSLPDQQRRRLVIDIGGGSTELVIGQGFTAGLMESINMGCVSYTTRFLDASAQKASAAGLKRAVTKAELELQPIARAYRDAGWDEVVGCSGTIKAAAKMLAEQGLTDGSITREGLQQLLRQIGKAGSVRALRFESISSDRAQVVAGGLAVLFGVMRALHIDVMQASQVALREGLIFDMIGKAEHLDVQSQTLENLARRYSIDRQQAARVEDSATRLFERVQDTWQLDRDADLQLLGWAAKLHELGMGVAHTQYHKHGAYILENSDLFGFSLAEQTALALLVRFHRRKIDEKAFDGLPDEERERLLRLLSLLRLAALLHRGRHEQSLDEISVRVKEDQITVRASEQWLDENPLTATELADEAERLLHVNIKLKAEKSDRPA